MFAGKNCILAIILCLCMEQTLSDPTNTYADTDMAALKDEVIAWSNELGFQKVGITDIDLQQAEARLNDWLRAKFHGSMHYMERHGKKRSRPDDLVPGTLRIISVRMNYLPESQTTATERLDDGKSAYISRYALGRDYHKVLRGRLRALARRIEERTGEFGYRVFVDSAPVLEKALAEKAGLGWVGKHTNVIDRDTGSWFFLGELYTNLPLPVDTAEISHCGTCTACIDVCPTKAIVAPYSLDARRCISYLTIENKDSIPVEFRKDIGNRIYGCDDCQLFCPWNKFAEPTAEKDFAPRHGLENAQMVDLFMWSKETWLEKTEGSAIRRIGFECWLRNIAVALGNAVTTPDVVTALRARADDSSQLVAEHVQWALTQHENSST